eukprot:CAMPEP_0178922298 /NCGR_PEP_ID=MMETSP0786-20121207/16072_1 /TAXON_ID=186022 /ORGANISM="Thalassionema frauenfeldii, Strain CCMP 1798" /LENGTH=251 /DNA_ID=CAMNT_0020596639 /DNA_START=201 /DNA_END=956 /DNA_ORIENTATION=-
MASVGRHFRGSVSDLIFGTWKQPLADDMGWAFQKGLAGLLSHHLSVPASKIDKGDDGIEVDTAILRDQSTSKWTDDDEKSAKKFIEETLEERLRAKYEDIIDSSVHDIRFKCRPLDYSLEYAYVIPILTREIVAQDPSLLEMYRDLDQSILSKSVSPDDIKEQVQKLMERVKDGDSTFTLIVDMSVKCLESFSISNKETGDIIQGSDNEQEVYHLVRFENIAHQNKKPALGNWIISDWDDLLNGNVWHLKN